MIRHLTLAVGLAALLLAAGLTPVAAAPATYRPLPTATIALHPVGGSGVSGVARLKGFPASDNTLVEVRVTGLGAQTIRSARIHSQDHQQTWDLKDLRANAQGVAAITAMVPSAALIGNTYHIHVHANSLADPAGVGPELACGCPGMMMPGA